MSAVEGFRKPWEGGAKAYPQADTFAALRAGLRRRRKTTVVHMPNEGEAGAEPCATCGVALRDAYAVNPRDTRTAVDDYSTWTWLPGRGLYGQHYYCSWRSIMADAMRLTR